MARKLIDWVHWVKRPRYELLVIILIPMLIFAFGQIFLMCLSDAGVPGLSISTIAFHESSAKKTEAELPHTTKYIVGATFGLGLISSIFLLVFFIKNLIRRNFTWIIPYILLSVLLVRFVVRPPECLLSWDPAILGVWFQCLSHSSPLDKFLELTPVNNAGILGRCGIDVMIQTINFLFIFASLGLVFSAAALIPETNTEENPIDYHGIRDSIRRFEKLRVLIVQGSCLFASGMLFMHFWVKYSIEIGVIGDSSIFTAMAYGIEIFNAVSFFTVLLSIAVLTHLSLHKHCVRAIDRRRNRGENEELLKELRAKASYYSYYRELVTVAGLFAIPFL